MTAAQVVYTGTIGCHLHVTAPADLVTGVASVVLQVKKPSGAVVSWASSGVEYDQPSGISTISYETVAGDLNEAGLYRVQPLVTMNDGDVWPLGVAMWKIVERFEVS